MVELEKPPTLFMDAFLGSNARFSQRKYLFIIFTRKKMIPKKM